MVLLRIALYILAPLTALLLWWSAKQATLARHPVGDENLTVMLPGPMPVLNPFVSAGALDRQISRLLHEPLLRLDAEGSIAPALAADWDWSQKVCCWFATADIAAAAADHLKGLDADRWIAWKLDEVTHRGSELQLRFAEPDPDAPDEALREIAAFEPLPIDFVRLSVEGAVQDYLSHYLEHAVESSHVRRIWFDGAQVAELVVCGAPGNAVAELRQHFEGRPELSGSIAMLGRVAALREPQLEFRLHDDRLWPDQTPVTAADAAASARYVMDAGWPIPNRETFRQIQSIATPQVDRLVITYRRFFGAALCGWIDFPILPSVWLQEHPPASSPFLRHTPPGAGPYQITTRREDSLVLDPRDAMQTRLKRLQFQPPASDFVTQVSFAAHAIDVYWPPLERLESLKDQPHIESASAPPHNRLLVLWNTKREPLSDLRLRRALSLGTDRQFLINDLVYGAGGLHDSIFPPRLWFSSGDRPQTVDQQAAREELDQAGWLVDVTSGLRKKPDQPLEIEVLTLSGSDARMQLARKLAAQWEALGVAVTVTSLSWDEMVDQRLLPRDFDAAIVGLDFELSWDQSEFWHSSQAIPGGLNFTGLQDREIDAALDELRVTFDPEAVPDLARRVDGLIRAQHPYLSLFTDLQPAILRGEIANALRDSRGALTLDSLVQRETAPPTEPPPDETPIMRLPEELPTQPLQAPAPNEEEEAAP